MWGTGRTCTYSSVAALIAVLAVATPAGASGVTTDDLVGGPTATQIAQALAGPGVAISDVTYTGAERAAGTFSGGTGNVGIASGIVLSSGNVQTRGGDTPDDPCSRGVEGPNNCSEHADAPDGVSNSTPLGTAGDASLDALISPDTTQDATVLQFNFVPTQSTVQFRYVFSSEEYNDYVHQGFNDVFGFFVNGTNCATVPGTSTPVSIDTINDGDIGGNNPTNPTLYRDNVRPSPSIDTQMDGLTVVLTCNATVNPGVANTMKLAIADVGDSAFDSAVFLEAGSLVSGRVLTVSKNGTGTGTVTSSPAGIDCGATCAGSFADGTVVTLTPAPSTGSQFAGWSGACTGTGSCTVTMSDARSVTATFNLIPGNLLTVTKAGAGSGTVTSSPAGIDCGSTCSFPFDGGTVTLTATPADAHSTFTGWSGACTGTGTCQVTMDQARSVTATFGLDSHALTVSKSGTGSGTVAGSPAGVDCGSDCSESYVHGTVVTLTAAAATGSTFTGWSGDCTGTGTCVVTLDQARNVTATFTTVPPTGGVAGPPNVGAGDLFCGVQHRGKCKGLKVKGTFDRPGNAVWTFAAYNPTPGNSGAAAAATKIVQLGRIKRTITQAGTVQVTFKLKKGNKTRKLYRKVRKLKLKAIRVTLTFTSGAETVVDTDSIKLKR